MRIHSMVNKDFVHLHTHSEYSILDGMSRIKDLVELCHKYKMPALALTEHGNLFSAVPFYRAVNNYNEKNGTQIKPILGAEVYVAPKERTNKNEKEFDRSYYHLLLLCENETGYNNLCKLISAGYLEGYYKKPRIDMKLLANHHEGLIAGSGCISGRIPKALSYDKVEIAENTIGTLVDIFGKERFFLEIMYHSLPEEDKVNPKIVELSKKYKISLIATQDSHYTYPDDADAHEILLCIQSQDTLLNEKHWKFGSNEFYFRSPDEMYRIFKDFPEACRNTLRIAEMCSGDIIKKRKLIPKYIPEDHSDPKTYLRKLVNEGLKKKFEGNVPDIYKERAEYELRIIEKLNFVDYFLVVWDIVHYAKTHSIPVGPGRGSAAGSIVAYVLGITDVDPIRYQLLFERFLNPERVSDPDIDIDFADTQRSEIIRYAISKYGAENVAQIATFQRSLARNVVRDVGRALGMEYNEVDQIAKMIPAGKITLNEALEKEPDLKQLVETDSNVKKLWNFAIKLEGIIRNCGTHAAGIVICDKPIVNFVALFREQNSEFVATQAEKECVEYLGLLKMDILGLKTLTVIDNTLKLIKKHKGITINLGNIPLDDKKTFKILREGKTLGVFQLESSGMRDVAIRLKVSTFEEISALVALYRPGPMKFIDTFIQNKFNPEKIQYWHPSLEPIVKETYGIPIYQEQVMQIAQTCAGFSLPQSDTLRSGMAKKKIEIVKKMEEPFINGCKKNGIDGQLASQIYSNIQEFSNYGFNKSHSVAYALLSYQTAYLKANFPEEYMCALLTSETDNLDKISLYVQEAKRMGISIFPPDINKSDVGFTIEDKSIRFGLGVIKNVGIGVCQSIVEERELNGPYKNIFDFCQRLNPRQINKRVLENLIKAGAFDSFGVKRKEMFDLIDISLAEGQRAIRDRELGQISLFDESEGVTTRATSRDKTQKDDWALLEKLTYEKEVVGLYLTGHPLEQYKDLLSIWVAPHYMIEEGKEGDEVIVGGIVSSIKYHTNEKGKMAFVSLEGIGKQYEVTFFSDVYEESKDILSKGSVIFVLSKINFRKGQLGLIARTAVKPTELFTLAKALHIRVNSFQLKEDYDKFSDIIVHHTGECDVFFHFEDIINQLTDSENDDDKVELVDTVPKKVEIIIQAHPDYNVTPTPQLLMELENIFGEGNAWFSPGYALPLHINGKIKIF